MRDFWLRYMSVIAIFLHFPKRSTGSERMKRPRLKRKMKRVFGVLAASAVGAAL